MTEPDTAEPDTASGHVPDDDGGEGKRSAATRLVALAERGYTLGCTPDGEAYAVPMRPPLIVRTLRGGRQSLRAELASAYYDQCGTVPSQSALADACTVLEGKAQRTEPADLHLRVAERGGALLLDLGDVDGRAVRITSAGWDVVDTPPVLFRRTALTGALPVPERGGTLDTLWRHLNVRERYRPIVAAVLVSALMPRMPHPVVVITGEQGTGKTTATARLAAVVDPSPAQVRKAPRDVDAWTTAAAGSWVTALDNLSGIPEWLSDALCRASTGDGDVRRRLYSDGDLHVIAFRRAVIFNGVDVGALRGDLADRAVHLDLDVIGEERRRDEERMAAAWADDHPRVLGAVLDLACRVLGVLPSVHLDRHPRMADYARVLAAVDLVMGTDGLATYSGLARELAEDAAASDPVVVALAERITAPWSGTSAELLTAITPPRDYDPRTGDAMPWRPPRGWPRNARDLTGQMKRQAPTLRALGWTVAALDRGASRVKSVGWDLTPPPPEVSPQRLPGKDAADAADAAPGLFPQVNGGGEGAASGAASARRPGHVAADAAPGAASRARCRSDAAPDAAPTTHGLSSANEDHAASAASAARNPANLLPDCSTCGRARYLDVAGSTECEACRVARRRAQ